MFTDAVIRTVAKQRTGVVFLLWGKQAQDKERLIAPSAASGKHLLLKAPHPSGLSAHRGFFGCKHYSATNEFIARNGGTPIDWSLE